VGTHVVLRVTVLGRLSHGGIDEDLAIDQVRRQSARLTALLGAFRVARNLPSERV